MLRENPADPPHHGAVDATIPVPFDERVLALAPLRLSSVQTEFIVTVALHGGYCLQRQYDAFVGHRHGQVASDFFSRLTSTGLAHRLQLARHRGFIYHLHAKALYRALRQVDNRNRRRASSAYIARKLMILDYVLATQPRAWLATEQDKVAVFTTRFDVPTVDLPQRRYRSRDGSRPTLSRYFVHKLPIAVHADRTSVGFAYLVVDRSGEGFKTFLADHARLLSALRNWTIVAVCPGHINGLPACRQVLARQVEGFTSHTAIRTREDVLWFFRVKLAVERRDIRPLSVPEIHRFRELRDSPAAVNLEPLFAAWKIQGDAAVAADARWRDDPPAPRRRLVEHSLPFPYEQFGSWPGLA
jgi:hypothetical protein